MAELPNLKHEKFCQEYIKDSVGSHAYRAAYGSDVKGAVQGASRLLKKPDIQARIAELRAATAERNEVTIDSLVAELDETIAFAKDDPKQSSARVNAITAKAKITGNWVDRVQVSTVDMTDDQLAAAIAAEQGDSAINWPSVLDNSKGGTAAASNGNGKDKQPPATPGSNGGTDANG